MKKTVASVITMTIFAAIVPIMVSVASASPTVTLSGTPYYNNLGGGEFTAYTSDNFLGNYATVATYNNGSATGFETFCIETGVECSFDTPYSYTLGNTTTPLTPPNPTAGSGLVLSQGTAYLYQQFGQGLLNGFDYLNLANRQADDALLQAAIWYLQGGQTYGSYVTPTTLNNMFYADALTEFGGAAGADAQYTGSVVAVMQLSDGNGNAIQNQLVLVPDGGATLMLLGLGLAGLRFSSRRLAVVR